MPRTRTHSELLAQRVIMTCAVSLDQPRDQSSRSSSYTLILCSHMAMYVAAAQPVRLEPTLIELEREKEDLLIIGHSSTIRCLLAYLIGLPATEIPAIEVARGDLIEILPASYGVRSQVLHFWDGPGRRSISGGSSGGSEWGDDDTDRGGREGEFAYENYAEAKNMPV